MVQLLTNTSGPGDEPRHSIAGSDMKMQMPIVLLVAERGQYLASPMLVDDPPRDVLNDGEQLCPEFRIQLQQRADMPLRNHDHMIGSEPGNRRAEGQHMIRLGHDV